ncbi:MAG: DUF47 family protein [Erysipelotrichaceae bacterium]|nr:DUF47 family protein [Erysipelotrichaceae bacterium]MDD3810101.1 DUF47 family protein [Erysipelotrichaceae bacterium]
MKNQKKKTLGARIRSIFIGRKVEYFDMFIKGVAISQAAVHILQDNMSNGSLGKDELERIKELKQNGTRHVHESLKLVEEAFITPIDQRDIIEILEGIDAGLHSIESVANHFYIMDLEGCDEYMKMLLGVNMELCERINELMILFKRYKNVKRDQINAVIKSISDLEEQGDAIYSKSMLELFRNEKDPLVIVKKKEIYQRLEYSGDCFKRVGDVIEGLITVSL